MTVRLRCGHPVGWMLRLRDGPRLYKYCWGCIIERSGVPDINKPTVVEHATPTEVATPEPTKVKKK